LRCQGHIDLVVGGRIKTIELALRLAAYKSKKEAEDLTCADLEWMETLSGLLK
jgi:hypothetical protein